MFIYGRQWHSLALCIAVIGQHACYEKDGVSTIAVGNSIRPLSLARRYGVNPGLNGSQIVKRLCRISNSW
jgi:hypothetical protein